MIVLDEASSLLAAGRLGLRWFWDGLGLFVIVQRVVGPWLEDGLAFLPHRLGQFWGGIWVDLFLLFCCLCACVLVGWLLGFLAAGLLTSWLTGWLLAAWLAGLLVGLLDSCLAGLLACLHKATCNIRSNIIRFDTIVRVHVPKSPKLPI